MATPVLTEKQTRVLGLFSETAGKLEAPQDKLHLKPGSSPVFAFEIRLGDSIGFAARMLTKSMSKLE